MANYRQVHTKIWKDAWFIDLPADDKLLFIYLFSNEQASISGIYELPIKVIAFETGLSVEYVTDALRRFEEAGKVRYQGGIVWVVNLRKYNENPSPKVRARIESDTALVPDMEIKQEYIQYHNGIGTVCIPILENGDEHEQEIEQEQEPEQENEPETDTESESESKPSSPSAKAAKPPQAKQKPKQPPALLPDTPEARRMFGKLQENARQRGQRGPQRFGTLEQKQCFLAAVTRLDGRFDTALEAGLKAGIVSLPKMVAYLSSPKWQEKKPEQGEYEYPGRVFQ